MKWMLKTDNWPISCFETESDSIFFWQASYQPLWRCLEPKNIFVETTWVTQTLPCTTSWIWLGWLSPESSASTTTSPHGCLGWSSSPESKSFSTPDHHALALASVQSCNQKIKLKICTTFTETTHNECIITKLQTFLFNNCIQIHFIQ